MIVNHFDYGIIMLDYFIHTEIIDIIDTLKLRNQCQQMSASYRRI